MYQVGILNQATTEIFQ